MRIYGHFPNGKPHVGVFGLGYAGSVMAACLVHKGHHALGVDVNSDKVEMLNSGGSPVLEARLDKLIAEGRQACRLYATTDATATVRESEISFVCVGTPVLRTGKLDLRSVERVFREVGQALHRKDTFHTIVLRSTILPGTTNFLAIPTLEAASGKRAGVNFAVCVNPEFMREGSAVADFFEPPFTILGAADPSHLAPLRGLYHWVPGRSLRLRSPRPRWSNMSATHSMP